MSADSQGHAGSNQPKRRPHRVRNFLIALSASVVVALIAVLALGVLSGGSQTSSSSPVASNTLSTEGCTTRQAGQEVRVTIYGNGATACSEWNEEAAKSSGEYWKAEPESEELAGELVCSMAKGGTLLIEVRYTGAHFSGNKICAGFTAKGWHEAEGPGAAIERERAQRKAGGERAEGAEQRAQDEREALKHKQEQAQLEKEEATRRREEARERQKEGHEREQEEAKQHEEIETQQQQIAREDRHVEEETHRAEREAQNGE
jgi:hypothetical protein